MSVVCGQGGPHGLDGVGGASCLFQGSGHPDEGEGIVAGEGGRPLEGGGATVALVHLNQQPADPQDRLGVTWARPVGEHQLLEGLLRLARSHEQVGQAAVERGLVRSLKEGASAELGRFLFLAKQGQESGHGCLVAALESRARAELGDQLVQGLDEAAVGRLYGQTALGPGFRLLLPGDGALGHLQQGLQLVGRAVQGLLIEAQGGLLLAAGSQDSGLLQG
jgi:hypothetical protein